MRPRLGLVLLVGGLVLAGCGSPVTGAVQPIRTPVEVWLAQTPSLAAHRGGSADWPEGTSYAYDQAADWSPTLALEAPVWLTADGVWVVCHDATTGAEFDADLDIATSTWAQLSALRTVDGDQPLARLSDVLAEHPDRVWLIDDKPAADPAGLLDLLDAAGGPDRFVLKSYGPSVAVPEAAHRRGYLTWGYWFVADLPTFDADQERYDLLALPWDGPASAWTDAVGTGKPVFGHVVATAAQAQQALAEGATGLMVSGVTEVVPR
ncbi:glycerophosphodiester phosphodiesterase family protein [Klenkia brasiliensis]|uniref:Glycerophosphoryl diester phosphodiesterase n=1 Tax=Klenkia brasiliensis TaxID=333142 RepID=A0A1G7YT38_9ACTN|nr:glycerophosphodiester phosphodiesterase family protein [Klenkia brasiliensis]SDG99631.1 Glycerophosphoryl diester phosphodiesterase [Klenkia brasiliensis]